MGRAVSLATLPAQSKKSVEIAVAHFRLSPTTKLLILLFGIGSALVTLAIVLDKKGVDVPGNGLRWLYLFGSVTASMMIWNGLVELVYLWLELKYFLHLVMLPSAQLLFKVWLNAVTAFVAFEQLFRQFTVGGVPPPQPLSPAERWIRRLLLCWLLFTCVCVAVTAVCNVVVAIMYSEGSRQKIVAAMQHEYVMYRLIRKKLWEGDKDGRGSSDAALRQLRKERRGSNGAPKTTYGNNQPPSQPPMQPQQQRQQQEPWVAEGSRLRTLACRLGNGGQVEMPTMTSTATAVATAVAAATPASENGKPTLSIPLGYTSVDASMLQPQPPPPLPVPPLAANDSMSRIAVQLGSITAAEPPSLEQQQQLPRPPSSSSLLPTALSVLASPCNNGVSTDVKDVTEKPVPVTVMVSEQVADEAAVDVIMPRNLRFAVGPDAATETDSETDSTSGSGCGGGGGARHGTDSAEKGGFAAQECCGLGTAPARPEEAASSAPSAFSLAPADTVGSRLSSASLLKAMQKIRDSEMLHVRRTLMAALEVYDWLREESLRDKSTSAAGPNETTLSHRAARLELHAIRKSGVRLIISPRALLDEMLMVYGGLSELDIPLLATIFQRTVWKCVGLLSDNDIIQRKNFKRIFRRRADRQIAWDALDGDKDGKLTREDVRAAVVSFLQQERSMALTVRAVRRLTWSLQSSLIAIINGIFLVPVYLTILDVVRFFNGGNGSKTSLDIFSVYVLVVSLIFSEQIKHVLLGCVLILTQQPFDVGEELVIEESPGWRVMGIVQDFNLFFLRVKKSTDGELVTLPLNRLAASRFTNLTRSDWKIEQNYFAVDASTPPFILEEIKAAAERVINRTKSEYDELYGFLAVFHGFERPNKVVIRTFHRYKFNLAAPHKRIANARHGIISAIREVFDKYGIDFTEVRMHMTAPSNGMQYIPGATAAAAAAGAAADHHHLATPAALLGEAVGSFSSRKSGSLRGVEGSHGVRGGSGRMGGWPGRG